jgi:uncharacterized membrane protein
MLTLMTDTTLPASVAADMARQWATLDWGRKALTLVAFLAALGAALAAVAVAVRISTQRRNP